MRGVEDPLFGALLLELFFRIKEKRKEKNVNKNNFSYNKSVTLPRKVFNYETSSPPKG